ncbi:hypothetical protein B0T24DRAFT_568926 [Lasiosphaeria ovina]|uniref:Hsp70 family chaperone n=1 Tax=Lasiosphaeria ovina TaxID=92902 RepID=A0AAE0KMT8_9PEZI|nr:hypothetical protein B0T24DRAFT_568926 [Lasiosphaeria ovina]
MEASTADIVVSVDLGTTFTGAAWMTPRTPVQVISDWPGSGDRGERKVPTTLVYHADGRLSSWGFLCADDDDGVHTGDKVRREFFKIFLEPDTLAAAQEQGLASAPSSIAEAQQFATDFLRELYGHIKCTVETEKGLRHAGGGGGGGGGWAGLAVEFLFSVPTTWTSLSTIHVFKTVIANAGFGLEGARHAAHVDLTEAEAAAVATLKTSAVTFPLGSLFLTVDAGGGTTDLALMQVTSADQQVPQMSSMHAVNGVGVGATLIDRLFVRLVSQRLAAFPDVAAGHLPPDTPLRLARSHHFRTVKHKFGERAYMQPWFRIPVEGAAHDFSHAGLGIDHGRLVLSAADVQSLFDPQVDGIVRRIVGELDWLRDRGLPHQVNYMVLSGGLGSSAYVRARLGDHFRTFPHPNASGVAVIPCHDPQLVVSRSLGGGGGAGRSVLATRIARASYGVIVKEVYSEVRHLGEPMAADPYEPEKRWALSQIDWLIRKGDVVNPSVPLVKSFEIRLNADDATRAWNAEIAISHKDPALLPTSMKQGGAVKLCDVLSNLSGIQQDQLVLKYKRGTCFGRGHKFYICQFDVRVIVAPADLRFELWFGGTRFSANHEPIKVDWAQDGLGLKG